MYCQMIASNFLPLVKINTAVCFWYSELTSYSPNYKTVCYCQVSDWKIEIKKESVRIITFVVVSFLLSWYPSFINIVLWFFTRGGVTFKNKATNLFAIMVCFNALCTSAVYLWGGPALREATVRAVWGRVCPKCKKKYELKWLHMLQKISHLCFFFVNM